MATEPALWAVFIKRMSPACTGPVEALDCFLRTHMDVLVLGDYVVQKH